VNRVATLLNLNNINSTYIALISKIKNASCVTDFQSISLYDVLYKILSKVMANKLKVVLPYIISNNQSTFYSE
jgi:hypothetical protein